MRAHRLLGAWLAISFATTAFVSCKSSTNSGSGGGTTGSGGAAGHGGETTTSTTSGLPDAGPIVCKSAYTNIPKGTCDMLHQDCVPGKTCQPSNGSNGLTTSCSLAQGIKGPGEICYDANECDAKLLCVGDPVAKCVAICCQDNDEPCNGGRCDTQVSFGGGKYLLVCSYNKACAPLQPDTCDPGQGCHVADVNQGLAVCDDPSPSLSPELGACSFRNDCGNMEHCFDGVCLYYCDTTGAMASAPPGLGGCPADEKCVSTYGGTKIAFGIPNLGLCIPNGGIPDAGASTTSSSNSSTSSGAGSTSSSNSSGSTSSSSGSGGAPADAGADG